MNRVDAYLAIAEDYARWLDGLRWHPSGEAIEFAAESPKVGLTFAMAPEIAQFLEGFASVRDLVCFGHVLHMMALLGCGDPEAGAIDATVHLDGGTLALDRLGRRFRELGRPLRNAGALFARLAADVPGAADPPPTGDLKAILDYGYAGIFTGLEARAERPPLGPSRLEAVIHRAIGTLSTDDLDHWLRHGRGPIGDAGEAVARAAEAARPRSLASLLDALDGRERLAGATRLVPLLDGALSLPPRRLAPAELPTGGYADVATRGLPEQILPAQFGLDDLEFLRRFAEHELLYYHREEPRTPTAEELLVVLDQGVRTWGDVRLVLTAAALALGRQAARRRLSWLVATTADDGTLVDPTTLDDPEALGALLEASDLSTNPGLALERVLEAPADRPRDVVLLTHPRSLDEPDVAAAARRAGPGTRLFAVAVDAAGRVGLAEFRRGAPVNLSRCRVEVRRDPEPAALSGRVAPVGPWIGDVEPIGFPFRLGVLGPVQDGHFDFDESGEWLLVADRHGLLHAWRVDGTAAEMLPRGRARGQVFTAVEAVVGVAGGFVVAGSAGPDACAVVVHYDIPTRECVAYDIGPWEGGREWFYLREYHAIALRDPANPARNAAVDLGNRAVSTSKFVGYPSFSAKGLPSDRASHARQAAMAGPLHRIVRDGETIDFGERLSAFFDRAAGELRIHRREGRDPDSIPLIIQVPQLRGERLLTARMAGDLLAVVTGDHSTGGFRLNSIDLAGGRPLAEYLLGTTTGFALSRDGRRLAMVNDRAVEVRDVGGSAVPVFVTPVGKTHSSIDVELGRGYLALRGGRVTHVLSWISGPLEIDRVPSRREAGDPESSPWLVGNEHAVAAEPPWRYVVDLRRFVVHGTCDGLTVLTDVFGQVAVLGGGNHLAAMFFVFRDRLAGWLPDGTRFGPPSLIGGPASPEAFARFGAALRAASNSKREGATVP
ncbi:MAG TPA: hypothetical protein VG406_29035 [Isosphaeraceae bacterium]|nr:hypothetical protein [Isosphaeraceae bacterium]